MPETCQKPCVGVLLETATRLVTVHVPPPTQDELADAIEAVGRELLSLGVIACHDPGGVAPDPDLTYAFPVYARLSDAGRLPVRVHACMRDDAVTTAIEQGHRSGAILGEDPDGLARVGWQKCFADGSLGSRTARLLEDLEPEPDRPVPTELRRGVWMTDPDGLRERVARASAGGITSQIHAIGDAAVREVLTILADGARQQPLMPPPRRPPPIRRQRHRGQRPAGPSRLGRGAGTQAVGCPGRDRGVHLAQPGRDRRGHGLRHGRAGRVVRSVAGAGPRRPP